MKNRNLDHKNDWKTPKYLIEELEKEFGKTFDPCPFQHDINKWDGLKREWGNINFINPPYSLDLKVSFVKKAIKESKMVQYLSQEPKKCIMLLPVSTSTKLFHEYILPNISEPIRFLKGRVKFSGWNTKGEWVENKCGMHDSMIVIF